MTYDPIRSMELANYLAEHRLNSSVINFAVLEAFVSNGADPLVFRAEDEEEDESQNLFAIASDHVWSTQSWLKLIEICKAGNVAPDEFTDGLAHYIRYQVPGVPQVDFAVLKAFVSNGADPLVSGVNGADSLVSGVRDWKNLFEIASDHGWSTQSWLKLIEICKAGNVPPDAFTDGLAHYIRYQVPGAPPVDFAVLKAFVSNGADPLALREGDWKNLFEIALENRWSTQSWLKLIEICKAGNVAPKQFTNGLAHYIRHQVPGAPPVDFAVLNAFVNNGADPLVYRSYGITNLLEIAAYNGWSTQSWLKLIEICKAGNVTPKQFTDGLAHYITGASQVDGAILKAFVRNGANLSFLPHHECLPIGSYKAFPSIPYDQFMQEFQQEFDRLVAVIEQFKEKTHNRFTFEQDYQSASIAGQELLDNLAQHRSDYSDKQITLAQFRRHCLCSIKTALQTDLAKQHLIYRALVSFLNFITGLTFIIPIASRITTGRWGLFTNSATESEKQLRKIADNLKRFTDDENNLPESTSPAPTK